MRFIGTCRRGSSTVRHRGKEFRKIFFIFNELNYFSTSKHIRFAKAAKVRTRRQDGMRRPQATRVDDARHAARRGRHSSDPS
jgi:hypothetical protein